MYMSSSMIKIDNPTTTKTESCTIVNRCQIKFIINPSVNSELHGDPPNGCLSKSLQLEQDNQRPVGPVHNKALQDRMPHNTKPHPPSLNKEQQVLVEQEIKKLKDQGAEVQLNVVLWDSFLSTLFLIPKKDGGRRPVINPKCLNSFVVSPHVKKENGKGRPKGRLLLSPDQSGPQEFLFSREDISVHMPPFRPDLSTLGPYQDPQTHSSCWTRVGVSSSNLCRQHIADGESKE